MAVRGAAAGLCVLAVVAFVAAGVAVDDYSMSGSSSIETPTQTVSYEGQEYTIDSLSRITAGESVTVTTSVPAGAAYSINLRGPDNQLISSERTTNDTEQTLSYFGPDDEAGTYAATIEDDGDTVAVHPIVVAGYDITVPSPDDVEVGEEATLTATVTERSGPKHSSLDRVEVVVGNDDLEVQQSMRKVDDETYETTVSTEGLAAETYNVYVVVRGNETVRDRAEILGVSDTVELTVSEKSTPTPTSDDGGGGVGGTGGETTETSDQTPTETGAQTPTTTATETGDQTPTATPTPVETGSATTPQRTASARVTDDGPGENYAPGTAGETATATGADDVIAPATADGTTTGGSGPGFTVATAALALLAAVALARHRE